MSKENTIPPHARTWRDIPQPVKPRTMSGEGRRRLALAGLRLAGAITVFAAVGWGALQMTAVLQKNTKNMPSAAKTVVVKEIVLMTDAYGVLDAAWATATLALPKNASLMELDLMKLRDRVLASGQVRTATLTLKFPDTLLVTISERSPVARIMVDLGGGERKELLVSREGIPFTGAGYDAAMIKTLPWLEGFSLVRQGGVLQPISGMSAVADLLAKAKLDAEHLYQSWVLISLARLKSDGEIEVRTREGTRVIFGNREDYFRQLARLDLLLDTAAKAQPGRLLGEINLAIGTHVPVSFAAATSETGRPAKTTPTQPATAGPNFQFKLKREL